MRRHLRWKSGGIGALMSLACLGAVEAQQTTFHGQVRPRLESRDPSGGGADTFTSMRVRLALEAMLDENLTVFIQAQDVRIWGEETSPLGDFRADNIDVHQAYFRYTGTDLDWLTASIGRMQTNFGGQRLVGAVDWAQQGQSFDGVNLQLEGEPGSVTLISYVIGDLSASTASENRQLYGAYATRGEVGPGSLDVFWLYGRARNVSDTDEHSVGGRYQLMRGDVTGRFEATYQGGTRAGVDVSAYMFGGRLGTTLADGMADVTLWYDYLSGDDPATPEVEVFNTLYATNHKFYGSADVFTNIPLHTGGAGLQDIAAKLAFRPTDNVTAGVDLHMFRTTQQGTLTGSHLADEIDLSLSHRYSSNLGVTAGFSYVAQKAALGEIGRLGEDQTWFYVMFDAIF